MSIQAPAKLTNMEMEMKMEEVKEEESGKFANTLYYYCEFDRILKAVIASKSERMGRTFHCHLIRGGVLPFIFVTMCNRLIHMYAKLGRIEDARQVFDRMRVRSISSFNTIISAYAKQGSLHHARKLFDEMPNRNRNGISWNAMISAYAAHGLQREMMQLFNCMRRIADFPMNDYTFGSLLHACSMCRNLDLGKQIHGMLMKLHNLGTSVVTDSALIDMYGKAALVNDARHVFDEMPCRNIIAWTAMISGYAQNGFHEEALKVYSWMTHFSIRPNAFTFATALSCCAALSTMELGRQIHIHLIHSGLELSNVFVSAALIDMYGKSGNMECARRLFDSVAVVDQVMWNVMVVGYAQNGLAEEALGIFDLMLQAGARPDHVTFVGVLSACSYTGMVEKGLEYFQSMRAVYGINPDADHYACMIDVVGRAGRLDLAQQLIGEMPFDPNPAVWSALLGACRIHGDMKLAKIAAEELLKLDANTHVEDHYPEPQCLSHQMRWMSESLTSSSSSSIHVTLSNMYAAAGRWEDVVQVRKRMEEKEVKKQAGCSWIEAKGRVHSFVGNDTSHPLTPQMYVALEELAKDLSEVGYTPITDCALHDVDEHQKKQLLCYHSEKLAFAFGLIGTPSGMPIRIVKNIRICADCHAFFKLVSGLVNREIVVRDATRFHHFKGSHCSCKDYW